MPRSRRAFSRQRDRVIVFTSNVQPKRRMRQKPRPWHCRCRTPLGPYRLNSARLTRCLACGVGRYSDPTLAVAPHPPVLDGAGIGLPR